MVSKRSIAGVLLLFGAVALTSWYSVKSSQLETANLKKPQLVPTSTITEGRLIQMNTQGQTDYIIYIKHGTQYSNHTSAFTHAYALDFDHTYPHAPPWHAFGLKGFYNQATDELELTQEATISRTAFNNIPNVRFEGKQLTVNLHTKIATSTHLVTFLEPNTLNKTTGIGMKAMLSQHSLTLLSHVKSTYDPTSIKLKQAKPLSGDNAKLIHIASDKAFIYYQQGIGIYEGNAHATQGSRVLTGNKITLYQQQPKGGLEKIIVLGAPAHYSFSPQAENEKRVDAYAKEMRYQPDQHLIILTGNARLTQGQNTFTGNKITYNTLTATVYTPSSEGIRPSLIIEPINQLQKADKTKP